MACVTEDLRTLFPIKGIVYVNKSDLDGYCDRIDEKVNELLAQAESMGYDAGACTVRSKLYDTHMELPTDVNGEIIHVGDLVKDLYGNSFVVCGVGFYDGGTVFYSDEYGDLGFCKTNEVEHFKNAVEDLVEEIRLVCSPDFPGDFEGWLSNLPERILACAKPEREE